MIIQYKDLRQVITWWKKKLQLLLSGSQLQPGLVKMCLSEHYSETSSNWASQNKTGFGFTKNIYNDLF